MKEYTGGCHCKKVRYSVSLDLEKPAMNCNCSHCQMKGFMLTFVPADTFVLQSGEDELTEYRFNTEKIAHLFCKHCGVQAFGRGAGPDGSVMVAVNLRTLDDVDLSTIALQDVDGKSF